MTGSNAAKAAPQVSGSSPIGEESLGLLSAGGPFERFPGPVVVVGRNGVVLSSNAAGGAIAELWKRREHHELNDAIAAALSGKPAQINPLLLNALGNDDEVGLAVDLVALPWAEGAAAVLVGRDVSLERSLRSALIESRQRYKDLVEASSDFAWETDAEGCFAFVSPRGALGYPAAILVGQSAEDFLVESEAKGVSPFVTRVLVDHAEVWFRDAAGQAACLSANAQPLLGPDGSWRGARGTCREITAERAREAELARGRHRERLLAYILKMVRDELEPQRMLMAAAGALVPAVPALGVAVYCRGAGGALDQVAQAGQPAPEALIAALFERFALGEESAESCADTGRALFKATGFQGEANGALCVWRAEGEEAWGEDAVVLLDEIAAQIGVANGQLIREAELERLSATDPLTGLLNRRSFMEKIERHFGKASGRARPAALLYVDLDNFKLVNDHFGHQAGDEALLTVTQLLRDQTRCGDLAARLGGDEFGLFFGEMSTEQARKKGQALLAAAARLADRSPDAERPFGLSVGLAVFDPARPEDPRSLIARADAAMYAVKHGGKGGLELAAPETGDAAK
ncbi:MAG: GGDEF domain-containing protein [Rhodospirillales bacterium]|nr:GGDEF domain-containing protein [Rhodospirillales bacterium]